MIKEPARSEKAVVLPRVMAPRPVVIIPTKMVAGMGHERRSLTRLKSGAKGTALSRARAHQVRPTVRNVPIRQGMSERKMMKRRPKVAAVDPVAWL